MKPQIKKLWVDALRSGKYKQGKGQLRTEEGNFCCLGVLCNLHAEAHPEIANQEIDQETYMGEFGNLPKEVAKWAGIDVECGAIAVEVTLPYSFKGTTDSWDHGRRVYFNKKGNSDTQSSFDDYRPWTLVELNDQGASFKQIADVIEASL